MLTGTVGKKPPQPSGQLSLIPSDGADVAPDCPRNGMWVIKIHSHRFWEDFRAIQRKVLWLILLWCSGHASDHHKTVSY